MNETFMTITPLYNYFTIQSLFINIFGKLFFHFYELKLLDRIFYM